MCLKSTITAMIGILLILCADAFPSAAALLPTDACTLLTIEQINSTLDAKLVGGEHIVPNDMQLCGWSEPGSAMNTKRVMLSIITPQKFEIGKTPVKAVDKTPVTGIGDDAYYTILGGLTTLSVKKGNFYLYVSVKGNFLPDKVKAMEKTLAQDALAKV